MTRFLLVRKRRPRSYCEFPECTVASAVKPCPCCFTMPTPQLPILAFAIFAESFLWPRASSAHGGVPKQRPGSTSTKGRGEGRQVLQLLIPS